MEGLHSVEGRVYWGDADPAGIAYFATIIRYCAAAEEDLLVTIAGGGWRPGAPVFPRVRVECDFYKPLRVHDRWRATVEEVVLGGKSIEYKVRLDNLDTGETAARGRIVAVAYQPGVGPVEIPESLRRALLAAGARQKGRGDGRPPP